MHKKLDITAALRLEALAARFVLFILLWIHISCQPVDILCSSRHKGISNRRRNRWPPCYHWVRAAPARPLQVRSVLPTSVSFSLKCSCSPSQIVQGPGDLERECQSLRESLDWVKNGLLIYFQSLTTFKSVATHTNIRNGLRKLNLLQKKIFFSTLRKWF